MAILRSEVESLVQHRVEDGVTLKSLLDRSKEMDNKWNNHIVLNENETNFSLNDDFQLTVTTNKNEQKVFDITENAFSQLCTRVGVPSKYLKKCFLSGKTQLAIDNFKAWEKENTGNMLIRESDGIARAVLSENYAPFDNYQVLRALNYTFDVKKFVPTQVFLSQEKLHIRFVDYTALPISDGSGSPLYAGFILSSNSVGCGAYLLNFLYIVRFVKMEWLYLHLAELFFVKVIQVEICRIVKYHYLIELLWIWKSFLKWQFILLRKTVVKD